MKSNKKQSRKKKKITHPKLIVFLLILLVALVGSKAYNRYMDWDNAQMIKGISRDFPVLVESVEKATGLELAIKRSCMTTQEKFNNGRKLCEIVALGQTSDSQVDAKFRMSVGSSDVFKVGSEYGNSLGYKLIYRSMQVCGLGIGARGEGVISLSCAIGVRDANEELARELFVANP